MIVTLTPNTTLDLTVLIPKFELNKTIRANQSLYGMAGKPTDASWVLAELGISSHALGFAAGSIAHKIETMLHGRGVTTDFVTVGGESRVNMVIVCEDGSGQSTITTSSLEVHQSHIDRLLTRFEGSLRNASCVVMGGSLPENVPPTFYADAIKMAKAHDIPVIFDAGEPNLSAGLAAGPTFIKPNQDELSGLVGERVTDMASAYRAGKQILEQYGASPIMTFGGEGALAVLPDIAYYIPSLKIEVVSAAGAGDAVLAGLAASIQRRQPIEDGLRLGMAAAAAVCLMAGTAECRKADVEAFLPQIELIPYGQ